MIANRDCKGHGLTVVFEGCSSFVYVLIDVLLVFVRGKGGVNVHWIDVLIVVDVPCV